MSGVPFHVVQTALEALEDGDYTYAAELLRAGLEDGELRNALHSFGANRHPLDLRNAATSDLDRWNREVDQATRGRRADCLPATVAQSGGSSDSRRLPWMFAKSSAVSTPPRRA